MGARLCALWHLISGQRSKSKSPGARDGSRSGSSFKEFIKPKCLKTENRTRLTNIFKRKIEMETPDKKTPMGRKMALQDWILASPDLKPDNLMSASKQCKKKVHPCSSRFRGSLISEAKDSLCLERPMNRHEEEGEGMSNCSSITKSLSGKSQKRVSFKLPHTVIFYSPDELCSPEEHKPYSSEVIGPNCRENSFDSAEEPFFRLAVDILPHVFVSSKI